MYEIACFVSQTCDVRARRKIASQRVRSQVVCVYVRLWPGICALHLDDQAGRPARERYVALCKADLANNKSLRNKQHTRPKFIMLPTELSENRRVYYFMQMKRGDAACLMRQVRLLRASNNSTINPDPKLIVQTRNSTLNACGRTTRQ
jgi:hypothetical protein